jgi:lysozyme
MHNLVKKWLILSYGPSRTVPPGMAISAEQVEWLLDDDLRLAAREVMRLVTVPLNENQFAALVSLVFNIGAWNFAELPLLRFLQSGWYEQVPAKLICWTKVGGEAMGGLTRRRTAEARLWSSAIGQK